MDEARTLMCLVVLYFFGFLRPLDLLGGVARRGYDALHVGEVMAGHVVWL